MNYKFFLDICRGNEQLCPTMGRPGVPIHVAVIRHDNPRSFNNRHNFRIGHRQLDIRNLSRVFSPMLMLLVLNFRVVRRKKVNCNISLLCRSLYKVAIIC